MNTGDSNASRLEIKAITTAAIEEVERQAAQNPSKLRVTRTGTKLLVNGEIDMDAVVMVVVGTMAGGA